MKKNIIGCFGSGLAMAWAMAFSVGVNAAEKPVTIQTAEKNGIKVLEQFPTPNNMTGWLVKNKSGYNVWYSDKEGYVFVGAFISPTGENLTATYLDQKAPKPDVKGMIESTTYVSTHPDKPSAKPVYVFYEPHCGFCSMFHAAAEPYIAAGAEVRWVPVAFLAPQGSPGKPSSAEMVAAILSGADQNAVIEKHESMKAATGKGMSVGGQVTPEVIATIQHNGQVMNDLGITGTPAMVYVDEKGVYQVVKGFPTLDKMPDLFHMKRMDSSDSRLGRFGADPASYPAK